MKARLLASPTTPGYEDVGPATCCKGDDDACSQCQNACVTQSSACKRVCGT